MRKGKFIGEGEFGRCYLTKEKKVLKIYNEPHFLKIIDKKFLSLKNDTYIFPDEIIYRKDVPIATLSLYIDSLPLDKKDITIEDFINAIDKVYEDTDKISELGIETDDIFFKNMLYDGLIRIIDSDFYMFTKGKPKDINISNFNKSVVDYFSLYGSVNVAAALFYSPILSQLTSDSSDNRILKEFLLELKKNFEIDGEITTMRELRKSVIRTRY